MIKPMKPASLLLMFLGFASCGLAGCVSPERQAAADRDQCQAQGLAPSTGAFSDCLAAAGARRDDAEARRALAMRQRHDQEVDDFLTSSSMHP
ncbi:MAG: hypothetical protein ACHQAQ_15665 [Hyphomicrobiales bacterium]|jgi:hypothetical protein